METKICGARLPEEIDILEQEAVRYCGLWTGIEGHPNDLDDLRFTTLAARCRNLTPVAVCVRKPVQQVIALLTPTRVRMVQLHGFNTPRDVAMLKDAGFTVIKTLHLGEDGACPEARWISAYDKAGCDIYLMDRFGGADQIGSCGKALPEPVLRDWRHRLAGRRLWLAGGLTPDRIALLSEEGGIEAFDIDSAARHGGHICRKAARMLVTAARPAESYRHIA
ncbi:hypothetical protein [Gemmobacter caeruleus]|uniref:phosphoribosylanthranilate isomerase n=1 Tax=Gemmobacter caeruleus TaxID=2595004 RepID=UPI0011ECE37C|nr:hypothetical protein [Gemmobacter caeruleus]